MEITSPKNQVNESSIHPIQLPKPRNRVARRRPASLSIHHCDRIIKNTICIVTDSTAQFSHFLSGRNLVRVIPLIVAVMENSMNNLTKSGRIHCLRMLTKHQSTAQSAAAGIISLQLFSELNITCAKPCIFLSPNCPVAFQTQRGCHTQRGTLAHIIDSKPLRLGGHPGSGCSRSGIQRTPRSRSINWFAA